MKYVFQVVLPDLKTGHQLIFTSLKGGALILGRVKVIGCNTSNLGLCLWSCVIHKFNL